MSFKPIRTFLAAQLLEVDSDFEAYDNGFESSEIGSNDYDKRYHIFYGNVATTAANQNITNDTVTATVNLYFRGSRTSTDELDDAMDLANAFRIECLRRANFLTYTFIKQVKCNSIIAEPLDATNDNVIRIRLEFSISVIFGLGITLDV
jgi:hypothetical protein